MQTLLTILILILCAAGLGAGLLLANKVMRKGCSEDPDGCACKRESKDPSDCDQ